jgi:general secretion pathway protein G
MTLYRHRSRRHSQLGMTMIELIAAFTILALLSGMAVPLARYKVRRDKERELRSALKEIRHAIDQYKDAATANKFQVKVGTEGYPETLEVLVEGVQTNDAAGTKLKFLRRIPRDPMTKSFDWGMRAMKDDPKSQSWSGDNVFDIHTKSYERARDGTQYSDW